MTDTTSLSIEERLAALEQRLAHPAIAELIAERKERDAKLRDLHAITAQRMAAQPHSAWTVASGTPPPTTISREELLTDRAILGGEAQGKTSRERSAARLLRACENGSEALEAARAALLLDWRHQWAVHLFRQRYAEADVAARRVIEQDVEEQRAPLLKEQQELVRRANEAGKPPPPMERIPTLFPREQAKAKARELVEAVNGEGDEVAQLKRQVDRAWAKVYGNGGDQVGILGELADADALLSEAGRVDDFERRRLVYLIEEAEQVIERYTKAPKAPEPEKRGWFR